MGRHHNTTKAFLMTENSTTLKQVRNGGFQTLDVEHRTDSRRLLDQPPSTTTGTDEDGDRRRRWTKTEIDEDGDWRRRKHSLWGRAKWQLPYSWRHPGVTKTELDNDISPLMRLADSRAHEGCSSLRFQENRRLRSVDSPLGLYQLVWQKTNYKTFGTTA